MRERDPAMADTKKSSKPGHDGKAKVSEGGTVDTGGRPGWVWVTDDVSGHRFDIRSNRLPRAGLTPVEGYPINYNQFARPGKTRAELGSDVAPAPVDAGELVPGEHPSGDAVAETAVVEKKASEAKASGDAAQKADAAAKNQTAGAAGGKSTTAKGAQK